ncbi:MAG: hypothetical protein M1431_01810, partial [Candidatus Thermoplasmatota archaeon]|nr:hypothetical protein [Candidatus Thermoplasmatota archaeon]
KEYAIEYHLGYSRPLLLSLYLKGYGRSVKWELDNTTLQTNSYSLAEGGYYTIHASIIVSGLSVNITRTISVPYMKDENITVLSNVPGYGKPSASLIVNYFYSYSLSGEASVPVINGTNAIQVSAPGFRSSEIDGNAGNNVTVILQALPVRVSLFLFPANVNVTLNGVRYYSNNGTYSGLVEPGYAIINVSSPGFVSVAENVSLPPGINYTSQLSLEPLSPGWTEIYGNVIDSIYSFPVSGAMVSLANRTYAFTNSTGFYMVYATNDSANVSVNASLYAAVHENVILKGATELNFSLKPLDINTSSFPLVKITRYFPLLFFMGIVTWTEYTGHSFLEYQIYISRSPSFQNPEILTFTANTSTSTVIFGVYPGQTYYATIVLRLSNGEVFQSQTVRMGYENPVYLTVNIAIGLGMAIYLFMTVSYLRKRWKKPPVEI